MIIEQYKDKDGVMIYVVDKNMSDEKIAKMAGKPVTPSMIDKIIDHDADVWTKNNILLLRFRKNILNHKKVDDFYKNVAKFAANQTCNRGVASGSKPGEKKQIMANILGYMDGFAPSQKVAMREKDLMTKLNVRESRFNIFFPEEWERAQGLLREIDNLYKKFCPAHYKKQRAKADQTYYRIKDTAFTTITVNINFKTFIHQDKGDDTEGFGNLVVIGDGPYTGSETCFPQYGIGVNVQTYDICFMNVHEWHGNLPLKLGRKDTKRMAIVSYLRTKLWEKTRGLTKKRVREHDSKIRKLAADAPPRPKTKYTRKRKTNKRKNKTKKHR